MDDQTKHDRLEVETFGSDSALCPDGTSVMTVRLPTSYEFWTGLKKSDPQRYRVEKKRVVQEIIAILDKRFPGLAENLDRSDIATPATFVRYTGNWQGSYEGWLPTPRILGRRIPYTLPGLQGFLHGRPLGGGGRRTAVGCAFGPLRRADDLRQQRKSLCGKPNRKFLQYAAGRPWLSV